MAATAPHASRKRASTSAGVICLLAGALFGLLSSTPTAGRLAPYGCWSPWPSRSSLDCFSDQLGR